ncbi:tetratricopeptide repeat protein [Candidatus Gottesmanbacteria bacterium]|nr:tetratricopeptide repeat protein [Candidatus Gottesmanbacteria bacterium]
MSPDDLASLAIDAALTNNWQEAIKTNLAILAGNPTDVEALNRLARAHKEAGELQQARQTYRKVLKLDRFNPIAQKNLKLLEALPKSFKKRDSNFNSCQPQIFLEEPGKTKVVNLVNLAPASALLPLSAGAQTNLLIKRRAVTVVDTNGVYLGALPDDLSAKLIKFIKGGNRYEVFIKTVGKNSLSVFIKEIYRTPRFKNQPTFPGAGGEYYTFIKPEPVSSEEETEGVEEGLAEEELSLV